MKILVVVGLPGAGKDSVASFLKGYGIPHFTFSQVIRDELKDRGMPDTLENEEFIAKDLRASFGPDIIAQRTAEKVRSLHGGFVCLAGPRNIEELQYLSGFGEVVLVVVEADERTRFRRMKERADSRDPKTFEEFQWRQKKNFELGIGKVLKTQDYPKYVIRNDGTVDELKKQVERFAKKIGLTG